MGKKKTPLEATTEDSFVWHVYATGCWCLKLNPLGRVGLPDRLCVGPHKFILFVELKRLGEEPTAIQIFIHKGLRKFGFDVIVPDNIEDAVMQFNKRLQAHMKNH